MTVYQLCKNALFSPGHLSNAHLVGYGFTEQGVAKLSRGPDTFARI